MPKKKNSVLLEKLAEAEHVQWMAWSKAIDKKFTLPNEVRDRWKKCWVTYSKLSEKDKDLNRIWARRSLYLLKVFFRTQFVVQLNHSKFVEVMKKFKATGMDDKDIEELYNSLNKRKGLFSAKER